MRWVPAREQLFEEGNPLHRVRQHDLRHAAATHWLNSGVLPKTAQQWTGHRRLSVLLDIYVGVMREDAATPWDASRSPCGWPSTPRRPHEA